jgi:hypothetical protein
MRRSLPFVLILAALKLNAQNSPDSSAVLQQILNRLDTLEKQNQELVKEVRQLREQIAAEHSAQTATPATQTAAPATPANATTQSSASQASIDERLGVEERRTAEQAQTKVEAANKFPIQLNGMLLFNAFANGGTYADIDTADEYGFLSGPGKSGATLRQTILGLQFQGPRLPGDGHIHGSVSMDFWGGSSDPQLNWLRLRRADITLDWKNRSLTFAEDKPLIAPYQPDSLSEVGIPPLAGAGNLWLWLPQVRYEERLHFGSSSGFTGQIALLQTKETAATVRPSFADSLEPSRPALEGRFAFWHKFDDTRRFEIAPSFHVSTTHVAGTSVPSRIGSLDWFIAPWSHLEFSGTAFQGQNVASLGTLGNGFTIFGNRNVRPVKSAGGWAQLAFPITSRLTFNLYSGLESDNGDYVAGAYDAVRNLTYASNFMYHLGPNVIVSLEAAQARLRAYSGTNQIQNHYDLAIGYLF